MGGPPTNPVDVVASNPTNASMHSSTVAPAMIAASMAVTDAWRLIFRAARHAARSRGVLGWGHAACDVHVDVV